MVVHIDLLDEKAETNIEDGPMARNGLDLEEGLEGDVLLPSRLHCSNERVISYHWHSASVTKLLSIDVSLETLNHSHQIWYYFVVSAPAAQRLSSRVQYTLRTVRPFQTFENCECTYTELAQSTFR